MKWDGARTVAATRGRPEVRGHSRRRDLPPVELDLDLLDDERLLITRLALRVLLHEADGALQVRQIENATGERRRPWKDLADQCPALHRRAVEQLESHPTGQDLLRRTLLRDSARR